MADNEDLQRMWRVNRTCWEMLKDRGYLVPDEKLTLSFDAFKEEFSPSGEAFRESMTIVVPKISDPQKQVRAHSALVSAPWCSKAQAAYSAPTVACVCAVTA